MQALQDWMAKQFAEHTVEPHSGLGQAISYMQNHWEKLTLFLRVPGAPLDNNVTERILKKAILHRKNALFYRTLNGARVGDLFMTLIHTAELHQIEPFHYLVSLLRHSAKGALDPAAWMPWNYTEALARAEAQSTGPPPD
jgi:transposase